jgi:predicted tellurium resistance membrane protein TerC
VEPRGREAGAAGRNTVIYHNGCASDCNQFMFSLNSIIAAIGMVDQIAIMIAAVSLAYDRDIRRLGTACSVHRRTADSYMLALAFLLSIGVALVAGGFDAHIPRDDIYFAMALAGVIEAFNVLAVAIAALRAFAGAQRSIL